MFSDSYSTVLKTGYCGVCSLLFFSLHWQDFFINKHLWWRQPVRHAESLTIHTNLSTCAHIRMHAQPHTHTHILSVWFRTTWRVLAFINMYSVKKHGVWKVTTRSEKSDAEVERLVGGTAEKGWREVKRRREKMWLLKNQAVTVETAR